MELKRIVYIIILFTLALGVSAQTATISGVLKNSNGESLENANIAIVGETIGTQSDKNGKFTLTIPANKDVKVGVSFIGYNTTIKTFNLKPNEKVDFSPKMTSTSTDIGTYDHVEEGNRTGTMQKIKPKLAENFTSASGSFEAILKTLPGVSSNNELSSQYSVRGGNFDENLIYVNDIQIYRPFLIRSGRQEGLSFINSNLVSDIKFSAGGFGAKYGDKMSSVLDVTYKEPEDFGGSFTASLQGAAAHIEGASKNHRFTYLTGARFKSNQYVLQSLDTDGEYRPRFFDIQTYLTYDISEKWEIGFLGNIAKNTYEFIPQTRETEFGTINEALQLTVFFDGAEVDEYQTYFGAITNTFTPKDDLELKIITSLFSTLEDENFDIEGGYRIDELERDLSQESFGDVKFNRGIGTFMDHARNRLDANVFNLEHKGKKLKKNHTTFWGVKYQHEYIKDRISEWGYVDSAGYFIPGTPDSIGYTNPNAQGDDLLELNEVLRSQVDLNSNRYSSYLQRSWAWEKDSVNYNFTMGARGAYWDFNNEFIFSPRTSFSFQPNWERDYLFRISGGVYYQPPFYREMRDFDGSINYDIKSQLSYQAVIGSDYNFTAWGRPFKFTTDIYYKHMKNVIPYEVENVRIRYYATNNANAYAIGTDLKINGEFVKGVESWFSMSVMKTEENLVDDSYTEYINSDGEVIVSGFTANNTAVDSNIIEPGNIPRPTDQRVNFSLFFQDYLPGLPSLKMHIALYYATGLPFGQTGTQERYKATFRLPAYRRVDLGFSYLIKSEEKESKGKLMKNFKNIWLSAEVFNLLQINNVISYLWIKDVTGRNYAVPNYLTSRQINLKLHVEF
ncbi:MAG: TonB-dependent receptor [Vicingaceae bacterium]|nr:TonB-dependent receptor [Vicingaceae bacterium]